jgi:hypothetical protein
MELSCINIQCTDKHLINISLNYYCSFVSGGPSSICFILCYTKKGGSG